MSGTRTISGKMRRKINEVRRDMTWKIGIGESYYRRAKGSRILVYHGICQKDHLRFNTLFLTEHTFENHLKFFQKYFQVISLDDLYQGQYDKNRFAVCLTFDDGFLNNYHFVLPLLEKYQLPATFFITGITEAGYGFLWNDFISIAGKYGPDSIDFQGKTFLKTSFGKYVSAINNQRLDELLRAKGFTDKVEMINVFKEHGFSLKLQESEFWGQMNKTHIRDLSKSKWVTIGSHGYYHNDLARISLPHAIEEMQRTKTFLEKCISRDVNALAFPYGSYNKELTDAAMQCGYTMILPTENIFPGTESYMSLKPRFTINPFISVINQMHAIISGSYD